VFLYWILRTLSIVILVSRSGYSSYEVDKGYLLTPWSRVLLEKLTGFQGVQKFPAIHGTQRFITAFTSARHKSVPSTSFGRTTLGAKDVANKLFVSFLFSDSDVGFQLMKDVGLIKSCMLSCKFGSQMSCWVDTHRKDDYRWSRRITSANACSASTSIGHGSGFQ